jgi:hypothetical protein
MDAADRLLGLVLLAIALGPVVAGAYRLRARLLPGWSGAEARVAESVVAISLVVVALEAVGVAGALGRASAVAATAAAGLLAWWAAGRLPARAAHEPSTPPPSPSRFDRPARVLAVAAVAAVSAAWLARVIFAYRHGMETVDTLWYHLPVAARFLETGSVLDLHYLDTDGATAFYPSNGPLLHALALAALDEDALSPLINLGWLALALTAGWAIGKPFGRAPHCLLAVAAVVGTPALVATQPGGAYNDTMCLALGLAAVALLVRGQARLPASALAAMATGLALGTKFTMIAPAGLLAIGAIVAVPRGSRLRTTGVWAAAFLLLGGVWYVRNAIEAGNPLPSLDVELGPLSLPAAEVSTPTFTIAEYLGDGRVWRDFFIPGLRQALGLGWWALLALAAAGALLAAARGRPAAVRVAAAVAVLGAVAYVVTPQFLGAAGAPVWFVYNVRYAAVPLCIGLVLLPLVPRLTASPRLDAAWLCAIGLAIAVTQVDPAIWPTGLPGRRFDAPVGGGPAIAALALTAAGVAAFAAALRWRRGGGRLGSVAGRRRALAVATAAALAVGLWLPVAGSYASRRNGDTAPLPAVYRWGLDLSDQRIGIVGFVMQYPLYGRDLSNHVQYLTAPLPNAGAGAISSCRAWRRTVDEGRYDWLVLAPGGFGVITDENVPPEIAWTRSSPAARLALAEPAPNGAGDLAQVYRIDGHLDPRTCPAEPATEAPEAKLERPAP